jgi:hypothetical protein
MTSALDGTLRTLMSVPETGPSSEAGKAPSQNEISSLVKSSLPSPPEIHTLQYIDVAFDLILFYFDRL